MVSSVILNQQEYIVDIMIRKYGRWLFMEGEFYRRQCVIWEIGADDAIILQHSSLRRY